VSAATAPSPYLPRQQSAPHFFAGWELEAYLQKMLLGDLSGLTRPRASDVLNPGGLQPPVDTTLATLTTSGAAVGSILVEHTERTSKIGRNYFEILWADLDNSETSNLNRALGAPYPWLAVTSFAGELHSLTSDDIWPADSPALFANSNTQIPTFGFCNQFPFVTLFGSFGRTQAAPSIPAAGEQALRAAVLRVFPKASFSVSQQVDPEEGWTKSVLNVQTEIQSFDDRVAFEDRFYDEVAAHVSLTDALREFTVRFS
jgi:hypothetical protein